jgi:hypothetical protein
MLSIESAKQAAGVRKGREEGREHLVYVIPLFLCKAIIVITPILPFLSFLSI